MEIIDRRIRKTQKKTRAVSRAVALDGDRPGPPPERGSSPAQERETTLIFRQSSQTAEADYQPAVPSFGTWSPIEQVR